MKIKIFNRCFKQSCTCFESYDNFQGEDVWKFYMTLKENLKNSTKYREMPIK